MSRKHVVIIGGGFGGISAAKRLKKVDTDVTLIDKTNYHLFQPLLYQVATAAMSPGDIAIPIRAVLGNRGMKVILGHVINVNREENFVELKNGRQIHFDYLVIAPGSQYNYFGNDEWENNAPGLKSIADGLQVRERILLSLEEAEQLDDPTLREPFLTYVIIGGGPTGVEMAGAIAEIAKRNMMRDYRTFSKNETRIFLVEAGPQILNGYPDSLSEKARETLENMGVRVLLDTPVTDIRKNEVFFKEGSIHTPNIIWAAGVVASPLLSTLNAKQDKSGRVTVQDDLSLAGSDHIFVIGDAAHKTDNDGNALPALAPVALQQGKFVARLIKDELKGKKRKAFHYTDKGTMATIGRAKAVADIRGFKFSGFIAWLLWSVVHILFIIGFRNRFRVFMEWMWYYFTFKRGVRLITKRFTKNKESVPDE